jgi:hypothetical protein
LLIISIKDHDEKGLIEFIELLETAKKEVLFFAELYYCNPRELMSNELLESLHGNITERKTG